MNGFQVDTYLIWAVVQDPIGLGMGAVQKV